jgi:hypothetical protein
MGLRTRLQDLAKTESQHAADEIRRQTARHAGGKSACAVADRELAEVAGTIRTVTLPPRRSVPVLVAEVFDGTRSVNLVWIGRRHIAGIEPGIFVTARGRVCRTRGAATIYNPAYEIVPSS